VIIITLVPNPTTDLSFNYYILLTHGDVKLHDPSKGVWLMEMEYPENYCYRSSSSVCEIEEEEDHKPTLQKKEEEEKEEQDCVYVAVGKSNTSMHALSWTLNNMVTQSTTIYLIHVFPQIKHIPNPRKSHLSLYCFLRLFYSPLNVFVCVNVIVMTVGIGMVPRNEVSVEQVESYVEQERSKRRELLQKFLQSCSSSKVL